MLRFFGLKAYLNMNLVCRLSVFVVLFFTSVNCDTGADIDDNGYSDKYVKFNIQDELNSIRKQLNYETTTRLQFDKDLTEMAKLYRVLSMENEKLSKENVQLKQELVSFMNTTADSTNKLYRGIEINKQNIDDILKSQELQQKINTEIARNFTQLEREQIEMRHNVTAETMKQDELSKDIQSNLEKLSDHITSWNSTLSAILPDIAELKKEIQEKTARDCLEIHNFNPNATSGVYTIYPGGTIGYSVYCDMTTNGGGWTVIQRRIDGALNFYKTWQEYKKGFGNALGEQWIGNDALHLLTVKGKTLLIRLLENKNDAAWKYAQYRGLHVGDEASKYRMTFTQGSYSGTAGNRLNQNGPGDHNNMMFSTKDRDNDRRRSRSCAAILQGGWWFNDCEYGCLNCKYLGGDSQWGSLHFKSSWMMIR